MQDKNETEALFDEAIRLEQHGEWAKAIALYEQAADKWPEQATYARNCVARLRLRETKCEVPPPANAMDGIAGTEEPQGAGHEVLKNLTDGLQKVQRGRAGPKTTARNPLSKENISFGLRGWLVIGAWL